MNPNALMDSGSETTGSSAIKTQGEPRSIKLRSESESNFRENSKLKSKALKLISNHCCRMNNILLNLTSYLMSHNSRLGRQTVSEGRGGRLFKFNNSLLTLRNNLLLPLMIIFLLPSIRLNFICPPVDDDGEHCLYNSSSGINFEERLLENSNLLWPLIKFPFDKMRLTLTGSGLINLVSAAKQQQVRDSRMDLQEEETRQFEHLLAEHRGGGGSSSNNNNYPPTRLMVSAVNSDNYEQPEGPSGDSTGPALVGSEQPVANSIVTSATGGNQLETRNDLPAVRALNVKCEKNHMTVS